MRLSDTDVFGLMTALPRDPGVIDLNPNIWVKVWIRRFKKETETFFFFPCELHSAVEQCRCSGPGVEMSMPLTRAGTLWDVQSFKTWRIKRLHTLSTDVARYVQKHHSIQAEQQKRHQENKFHLCLSDDDISRLDTTLRTDTSFRGINVWLVSA